MNLKENVNQLVAKGKLEKAVTLLLNQKHRLDEDSLQDIIHLSRRLKALKKSRQLDTIERENHNVEINKVAQTLLELIKEISPLPENNTRRNWVFAIFSGIGLFFISGYKKISSFIMPENNTAVIDSTKTLPSNPAPKINVEGDNNTIIDMSGSKENTVNQTIVKSGNDSLELEKSN